MMIKLFLSDVDATLTDGIYHTTEEGMISKNFYTRDFHGMWMLDQAGVEVGIITVANDDVIVQQCSRGAKYAKVMKGVKDKLAFIRAEYVAGGFSSKYEWDEIAFIGDDVVDAELLAAVGSVACPSDAHHEIWGLVERRDDGFVSSFPGGKGCVREFAEYVLEINKGSESNE